MKPESLVIVNQNVTVNTFSDLVLTIKALGSLLLSEAREVKTCFYFRASADNMDE